MNENSNPQRTVELYSTIGTSLIINYPSGITYTNQVAGTSCFSLEMEGVLVPFENDYDTDRRLISLEIDLAQYFHDTWGSTGATNGIETSDADAIDDLLKQRRLLDWFHVDRQCLQSSFEAWIHVVILRDHAFYCHGFGPYPRPGILTWANSD